MTSEFDRRLHRAENDVAAIYDILSDIQGTQARHGAELARARTKLLEHDARFDGIDARFDGMDGRLDGIDGRLDGIDGRLDGIDGRLDGMDGRLDGMDGRLDGIDGRLDGLQITLAELLRRVPDPDA